MTKNRFWKSYRWRAVLIRSFMVALLTRCLLVPALAYELPNGRMTPGAVVSVSAAQVCEPGYARRARHPYDDTARAMSRAVRHEYGVRGPGYRVDHLVPIEAGGDPFNIRNLWPQLENESYAKDERENAAHERICSSRNPDATMREVQREFETNWTTVPAP